MAELIKTDIPHLVKESGSGAIINTNRDALRAYKAKKAKQQIKMQKVDRLESEIQTMKAQVQAQTDTLHDIQFVLAQLASRTR
tara:strand:- start:532 stop:780 length:249 start_codon:yes stop_codon:yes gene_type:complete